MLRCMFTILLLPFAFVIGKGSECIYRWLGQVIYLRKKIFFDNYDSLNIKNVQYKINKRLREKIEF